MFSNCINSINNENAMNLEDQVVNLELSKKLLTLGVNQNSLWYWCDTFSDDWKLCYTNNYENDIYLKDLQKEKSAYSAFTASELMELLPYRVTLSEDQPFNSFRIRIQKSFHVKGEMLLEPDKIYAVQSYIINYFCDSTECDGENAWLQRQLFNHNIWDENFCNALAKTLIAIHELDILKNEKT